MSISLLFWVIMVVWLLFGIWTSWPVGAANGKAVAGTAILWVLLALLGWQVFGPAIHH